MQVFTLPDSRQFNVLLTGDTDFVLEFAARLRTSNIAFHILPPMDELDQLDIEFDVVGPSMSDTVRDTEDYGSFAESVVGDIRNNAGAYTHIVELSIAPADERKATIEIAASVNPRAAVIVSSLTTTATEMGLLANVSERITGITLAPSIISLATTADIAGGLNTLEEFVDRGASLLRAMGYTPELVEDRVALVQVRVLCMLINEAAFAVMEGVATPEDIDSAMKLGVNYPKGLLAWADEIGIPVVALIMDSLYREYLQERYRPCVLLKQYIRAGWTGKSAGRGFFSY